MHLALYYIAAVLSNDTDQSNGPLSTKFLLSISSSAGGRLITSNNMLPCDVDQGADVFGGKILRKIGRVINVFCLIGIWSSVNC